MSKPRAVCSGCYQLHSLTQAGLMHGHGGCVGSGRLPVPLDNRKTVTVSFKVCPADFWRLTNASAATDGTVSSFSCNAVVGALDRREAQPCPRTIEREIKRLVAELVREASP